MTVINDALTCFIKVAEPVNKSQNLYIQVQDLINENMDLFLMTDETNLLINNLIAYWPLEEGSGTRFDSGLNNLDLSDHNLVRRTSSGKVNKAATFFSNKSQYLSIDSENVGNLRTQDTFSVMGWIFLTFLNDSVIMSLWNDNTNDREWQLLFTGTEFVFKISTNGIAEVTVSTSTIIVPGTFYHITAIYDKINEEIKIYLNEILENTTSFSGEIHNGSANFGLGGAIDGTIKYLDGILDEWGVWQKTLTTREIAISYNNGSGYKFNSNFNFMSLFMNSNENFNNNITNYIQGIIQTTDTINLFMNSPLTTGIATLYLNSIIPSIANDINLYLQNDSAINTIRFFIGGRGFNVLYDDPKPSTASDSDDYIPLSGSAFLYLNGLGIDSELFLSIANIHDVLDDNIKLYISGNILLNNSQNLVIPNPLDVKNNNQNLYIHGEPI